MVILSAFDIGESREAQSGQEPQQHYDNLAAHGLGLRCLHCKYNNNVHTCQGNRGKVMAGGENRMMQPARVPMWSSIWPSSCMPPVSRILTQNKIHSSKSKIQVSSNDRFGLNMDKSPV